MKPRHTYGDISFGTTSDHITGILPYDSLERRVKRIAYIVYKNKMRDMQQQRMERWIFQLADSMNVKLKYE